MIQKKTKKKKRRAKRMSKGKIGGIVVGFMLFMGLICTAMCIEKIPVGYEGVVYSMSGGVNGETLTQGWHLVPPTKKVKEFTISNEQLVLTQDSRDGSKGDDSFKVATSDDASILVSFQMSYRFISEDIVDTYKKFKGMDGESIIENRVKTVLKSKISEITTDYSMMDIYSGNRSEINNKITEYLNKEFSKAYGIEVLDASIVDVHPDDKLKEAIDNRVQALQQKQQAEAEQERIKVEAETKLIQAENEANIRIKQAEADAETKRIAAEVEAEANRKIAESLTPELIEKIKYEKWNGSVPQVQGSSTPIIDINN